MVPPIVTSLHPQNTIGIGGMFTSPKWLVYDIVLTQLLVCDCVSVTVTRLCGQCPTSLYHISSFHNTARFLGIPLLHHCNPQYIVQDNPPLIIHQPSFISDIDSDYNHERSPGI